ncbi:unnamed protein product [Rotaria sordida]|uniref:Uncharacterized protein n=1 Tax=Rotaria sordida TaxID=392033 RepID=A0A816DYR8_9BILA|nr:unnamed protein product [Rotaria sordida]CAF1639097.1 unnamed protein product [Rotaria sordida]
MSSKKDNSNVDGSSNKIGQRFYTSVWELPKISHIKKDTTITNTCNASETNEEEEEVSTHQKITITKFDAMKIFHDYTILYIGDPLIRTLYHDLIKLLSNGTLLDVKEVQQQNGEYTPIKNENSLKFGRQIGMNEYQDIRRFDQSESGTTCIYIHLPTIMNHTAQTNIDFLNRLKNLHIDLVIFSSYYMDMN